MDPQVFLTVLTYIPGAVAAFFIGRALWVMQTEGNYFKDYPVSSFRYAPEFSGLTGGFDFYGVKREPKFYGVSATILAEDGTTAGTWYQPGFGPAAKLTLGSDAGYETRYPQGVNFSGIVTHNGVEYASFRKGPLKSTLAFKDGETFTLLRDNDAWWKLLATIRMKRWLNAAGDTVAAVYNPRPGIRILRVAAVRCDLTPEKRAAILLLTRL